MKRKKLTIGLFGFGCVGYGLYEVLQKTPGLKSSIKRICVKDPGKERPVSTEHFTFDRDDILDDDEINTVVELIDDADAAFEIVKSALQHGKAVVTANKKMIAEHFDELLQLQRQHQVPILYEGSCCASIPIIRNLEEYYDNDLLESVEGIVNGSTNYILTKTARENISYEDALHEAQQQGYAESNPLLDTGGYDAKFKLQILLAHAFGYVAKHGEIFHAGIDKIGEPELKYAREKGYRVKLVAHASKSGNGKLVCFVLPKFVRPDDPLFTVGDVFNGISIRSQFSETQFFVGKGAGAYPTASAVLSDISALTYDYRYEYKKLNNEDQLENEADIYLRVYLRHDASIGAEIKKYFTNIIWYKSDMVVAQLEGIVSLKNLREIIAKYGSKTSVILIGNEEQKNKTGSETKQEIKNPQTWLDPFREKEEHSLFFLPTKEAYEDTRRRYLEHKKKQNGKENVV